jgi:YaaC-like protein
MINDVRDILTHDASRETWKYLRLFQSVERTVERLQQIHSVPQGKHESNLKKQARQVGYCLRQAEEYFTASETVELATRPLLLYYGCVNLSQALVLLKNDGAFSLDATRKSEKHRHHGLELNRALAEKAARAGTLDSFFSAVQCACHRNSQGELAGHFPILYRCLEPSAFIVHSQVREVGRNTFMERNDPCACADLQPLDTIATKPFSCWELLGDLPDLFNSLAETGVRSTVRPGMIKRTYMSYYSSVQSSQDTADAAPTRTPVKIVDTHTFFVNRLSDQEKAAILEVTRRNPLIRVQDQYPSNLCLVLEMVSKPEDNVRLGYYPDVVEDIHGQKYFILYPDRYLAEPASMFVLMYCFGMLSRYFPDVWMTVTDSRVEIAEVANTLLSVVQRKFPNLILDQLTGTRHHFHG